MSAVYSWLARRMTDFENHETQNGYESSLTLKLALFQSINSYFSLIYIVSRVQTTDHGVRRPTRSASSLCPRLHSVSMPRVLRCALLCSALCSLQAAIKNIITINGQQQHCTLNAATGQLDCMGELRSQLATLIILKFVMGMFLQFLLPLILRCARRAYMRCWFRKTPAAQQLYDGWRKARKASPLERDGSRPAYDPFDGACIAWLTRLHCTAASR